MHKVKYQFHSVYIAIQAVLTLFLQHSVYIAIEAVLTLYAQHSVYIAIQAVLTLYAQGKVPVSQCIYCHTGCATLRTR